HASGHEDTTDPMSTGKPARNMGKLLQTFCEELFHATLEVRKVLRLCHHRHVSDAHRVAEPTVAMLPGVHLHPVVPLHLRVVRDQANTLRNSGQTAHMQPPPDQRAAAIGCEDDPGAYLL